MLVLFNCKGYINSVKMGLKGKFRPGRGHEGPDGELKYSCTLNLISALDWGWVVNTTLRPVYSRE
jgi:hypothetical protein